MEVKTTIGVFWLVLALTIHLTSKKDSITVSQVVAFWGSVTNAGIWLAA